MWIWCWVFENPWVENPCKCRKKKDLHGCPFTSRLTPSPPLQVHTQIQTDQYTICILHFETSPSLLKTTCCKNLFGPHEVSQMLTDDDISPCWCFFGNDSIELWDEGCHPVCHHKPRFAMTKSCCESIFILKLEFSHKVTSIGLWMKIQLPHNITLW